MDTVLMEEMTSPEVAEAVRSGHTTAIIVAGAVEQHGPHLPMAADTIQARTVGMALARRLDALLAPVIPVGCSDHHLAFPGTFSIPAEVLIAIVRSYCSSLVRHGFRRAVVVSAHGGNFGPLEAAAPALRREFAPQGLDVVVLHDLNAYAEALSAPARNAGLTVVPLPHGDAAETSLVLIARPDLVKLDLAERGYCEPVSLDRLLTEGLKAITPNGILGDPAGATAEIGTESLARIIDTLADASA